jgi:hypothetical protein
MAHLARVRLFVIFVAPVSFRPVLQKFLFVRGLSWVVTPTGGQAAMVTVQTAMVVDFAEGGGWALAGAGDGSEPQSVNS